MSLLERLERLTDEQLDFTGAAVEISRLAYGRPRLLSPDGVVDEGCGTCSTKHWLLRDMAAEHWPERRVALWHRPYVATPELAAEAWGPDVAASLPEKGTIDVHTFATALAGDDEITIDVTFPVAGWDGHSSMPLHCGPGIEDDHVAGHAPLITKQELVTRLCDPDAREPFLAAVTEWATTAPVPH